MEMYDFLAEVQSKRSSPIITSKEERESSKNQSPMPSYLIMASKEEEGRKVKTFLSSSLDLPSAGMCAHSPSSLHTSSKGETGAKKQIVISPLSLSPSMLLQRGGRGKERRHLVDEDSSIDKHQIESNIFTCGVTISGTGRV